MKLPPLLIALAIATLSAGAADVRFYAVTKEKVYQQNSAEPPVLHPAAPYEGGALVLLNNPRLTAATIKLPNNGAIKPLTNFITFWERREIFGGKSGLDFGMPNGTYALVLHSLEEGIRTNTFVLSGDFYPNPPHVSNYADAQKINHQADFTLRWSALGLAADDFIQLRVFEGSILAYETGKHPGASSALAGNATSALIPRNTLIEGRKYRAEIIAWNKMAATATYPGAVGWTAYKTRTELTLRTAWPTTDVAWFGLMRKQNFVQTASSAPAARPGNFVDFEAFALPAPGVEFAGALVKFNAPQAVTRNLSREAGRWVFRESFPSEPALKAVYSAPAYEHALTTPNNGLRQVPLEMSTVAFPGPPHISNWNEASSFDHRQPWVLRWHPVPNLGPNDFIQVTLVQDGQVIFDTGAHPRAQNALKGNATSVTLPVNLLAEGGESECLIFALKVTSSELFEYPGSLGTTGSASATRSILRARGSQFPPPKLLAAGTAGAELEFKIGARPGRQCVLQSSPDLKTWTGAYVANAPAEEFSVRLPRSAAARRTFYRLLQH